MDQHLLVGLNAALDKLQLLKLANFIAFNPLLRGGPIFYLLLKHWFIDKPPSHRVSMLLGLGATCVATVLSVWLQFHWTPHLRPFLDASLGLTLVPSGFEELARGRDGSFPSDTGTLFFGLAAIVYAANRVDGALAFAWAFLTVGVCRVAIGWHYPSDIVGSLMLACACVYLIPRIAALRCASERLLSVGTPSDYVVQAVFFVLLADAYTLFAGLQSILKLVLHPRAFF